MKENKIAIIKNGKVDNIIVADIDFGEKLGYEKVIDVTDIEVGIGYIYNVDSTFSHPDTLLTPEEILAKKVIEEKEWRDSELSKTDWIVPTIDHPKHSAYLVYRQELRDYPSKEDFPNSERPQIDG